ncbi:MAG: hypothetical protein EOO11_21165 [Chitinophagaceae bacterium]|nr:MAG: hypothetical protein EOO11_21165 [Chitinophagaceae bacterium]
MLFASAQTAERLRTSAEPSGTTDLNVLLAGLLASMDSPVSLRCDPLPPAAGAEEEWWLLLLWLLTPLRRDGERCRYVHVHVQCSEDAADTGRYLLSVRCNSLEGPALPSLENTQLAALAERLQVTLQPPAPADTHCLFILQFAGKKI